MVRDRIQRTWARSSMAEQWPFKPLVVGSIPTALTKNPLDKIGDFFFLESFLWRILTFWGNLGAIILAQY